MQLYRVTCTVDAVVAAESAEAARAYAEQQPHDLHVERLVEPEVLLSLDGEEATVALAALERTLSVASGANGDLLAGLKLRIAEAIDLLDEQERLRAR
jgi:hypothetical protein